jgi:hypothetical protein
MRPGRVPPTWNRARIASPPDKAQHIQGQLSQCDGMVAGATFLEVVLVLRIEGQHERLKGMQVGRGSGGQLACYHGGSQCIEGLGPVEHGQPDPFMLFAQHLLEGVTSLLLEEGVEVVGPIPAHKDTEGDAGQIVHHLLAREADHFEKRHPSIMWHPILTAHLCFLDRTHPSSFQVMHC